jgi:hypothetical protein
MHKLSFYFVHAMILPTILATSALIIKAAMPTSVSRCSIHIPLVDLDADVLNLMNSVSTRDSELHV